MKKEKLVRAIELLSKEVIFEYNIGVDNLILEKRLESHGYNTFSTDTYGYVPYVDYVLASDKDLKELMEKSEDGVVFAVLTDIRGLFKVENKGYFFKHFPTKIYILDDVYCWAIFEKGYNSDKIIIKELKETYEEAF